MVRSSFFITAAYQRGSDGRHPALYYGLADSRRRGLGARNGGLLQQEQAEVAAQRSGALARMLAIGHVVELHSLITRPELNSCRGVVVKRADPVSGRIGVRLDGIRNPMAFKPINLVDVTLQAISTVVMDDNMLRLVMAHVERWARIAVLSAVCTQWRDCISIDPDLYRSLVVVGSTMEQPIRLVPHGVRRRGLHRVRQRYGARHFLEEGALPVMPQRLAQINPQRVEALYVEPRPDGEVAAVAMQMQRVLDLTFPRLHTLYLPGVEAYCVGAGTQQENQARAAHVREFVARHLRTLRHLHLNGGNWVDTRTAEMPSEPGTASQHHFVILDEATQPGLESLEMCQSMRYFLSSLDDTSAAPAQTALTAVQSWSRATCQKLKTLSLDSQPSLDDVVAISRLLPNLRRLKVECSPDTIDLRTLAIGLSESQLAALYLNIDSVTLPTSAFNCLAMVTSLRELAVVCDSCDWTPGATDPDEPDERDVTRHLHAELPNAAVLVCDCGSLDEHILDPLHRILLPTTEEEWHLEPGVLGRSRLPFLAPSEREELCSTVGAIDALWHPGARSVLTETEHIEAEAFRLFTRATREELDKETTLSLNLGELVCAEWCKLTNAEKEPFYHDARQNRAQQRRSRMEQRQRNQRLADGTTSQYQAGLLAQLLAHPSPT